METSRGQLLPLTGQMGAPLAYGHDHESMSKATLVQCQMRTRRPVPFGFRSSAQLEHPPVALAWTTGAAAAATHDSDSCRHPPHHHRSFPAASFPFLASIQ